VGKVSGTKYRHFILKRFLTPFPSKIISCPQPNTTDLARTRLHVFRMRAPDNHNIRPSRHILRIFRRGATPRTAWLPRFRFPQSAPGSWKLSRQSVPGHRNTGILDPMPKRTASSTTCRIRARRSAVLPPTNNRTRQHRRSAMHGTTRPSHSLTEDRMPSTPRHGPQPLRFQCTEPPLSF